MTKLRIFATIGVLAGFIAIAGVSAYAGKKDTRGSGTTPVQQGGTGTSNSPSPRPVTTSSTQ